MKANIDSCGEVMLHGWRSRATTKALLWAGIAGGGLYILGDVASGLIYNADESYSFTDQWISELTAIGSPVRPVMVAFILAHDLLVIAFGIGILRTAGSSRSLRWTGGILLGATVLGFSIHPFFPMNARSLEAGLGDPLHGILSFAWSLLIIAVVLLAGVACRGWFRIYSIATALVLLGFGAASSIAIQGFEENNTPLAGAFERVNAYALMAWFIVFAVISLRRIQADHRVTMALRKRRSSRQEHMRPSVWAENFR